MTEAKKPPHPEAQVCRHGDSSTHAHSHAHAHSQGHTHAHGHHHAHSIIDLSQATLGRIRLALILNLSFAILELVGGFWTQSLAILSSALHDFGDSVALALAYILEVTSRKQSDHKYSYGYRRFSTLAALGTGLVLFAGSLFILVESLPRIWSPVSVPKAEGMIGLAILGLVVNGIAAFRLSKGSSLNEKMLLWHLLEDVMSWSLVLLGGLALMVWNWTWLDPLLAVLLSLWVIRNVYANLRQVLQVILQAVPNSLNVEGLVNSILKVEWVQNVHHVHVWTLDGESHILTAHVGLQEGLTLTQWDQVKAKVKTLLYQQGLAESTLEFEDSSQVCLEPHHESRRGTHVEPLVEPLVEPEAKSTKGQGC